MPLLDGYLQKSSMLMQSVQLSSPILNQVFIVENSLMDLHKHKNLNA